MTRLLRGALLAQTLLPMALLPMALLAPGLCLAAAPPVETAQSATPSPTDAARLAQTLPPPPDAPIPTLPPAPALPVPPLVPLPGPLFGPVAPSGAPLNPLAPSGATANPLAPSGGTPRLQAPEPPAPRPALVAELSQSRIEITTGFSGTELLVFGATDRLIGPQPGAGHGDDVLIIARNAPQPMVVRQKINVLGFWINGPSARFRSVPGVYLLTGTRPLAEMLSEDELSTKRIGLAHLPLESTGVQDPAYRAALLKLKQDAHLWSESQAPLQIAGSRLFSARLPLPATVQTGDYRVEVMLVRDGRVLARQELGFRVERVGTAASISDVAKQQPLVYGVICILLAAFAGWMGSVLFRRS